MLRGRGTHLGRRCHVSAVLESRCPNTDHLYHYRAQVTRVIDGDTVVADLDLGCGVWIRGEHLRLLGIDAPEVRGVEDKAPGLAATEALRGLLEECDGRVIVRTHRDERGKFGRFLVEIWDGRPGMAGAPSLNAMMLQLGHAKLIS